MDLDEVADELYEVPPEEFIALRKARQDEAKADGDKALAKEIGALPKPSAAAWACNLLVRDAARRRSRGSSSSATCSARRRRTWPATSCGRSTSSAGSWSPRSPGRRRALAHERGHPVSTAVADPGRGDPAGGHGRPGRGGGAADRPAHLADVLQRHGDDGVAAGPPRWCARRARSAPRQPAKRAGADEAGRGSRRPTAGRREQEERRRAAEEKRRRELAAAREAAEEAAAAAEEARGARRRSSGGRPRSSPPAAAELQARVDELADQLADAEREAAEAAAALKREERRLAAAEQEAAEAAEARDRALARVAHLSEARTDPAAGPSGPGAIRGGTAYRLGCGPGAWPRTLLSAEVNLGGSLPAEPRMVPLMRSARLFASALTAAMLMTVTACGGGDGGRRSAPAARRRRRAQIAAVFSGTTTDADYTFLGLQALQAAEKEFGAETTYSESVAVPDAERVLREYVADGNTVVWTHGSQFYDATVKVAAGVARRHLHRRAGHRAGRRPRQRVGPRPQLPPGLLPARASSPRRDHEDRQDRLPRRRHPAVLATPRCTRSSRPSTTAAPARRSPRCGPVTSTTRRKAQQFASQLLADGNDVVLDSLNLGVVGAFEAVRRARGKAC